MKGILDLWSGGGLDSVWCLFLGMNGWKRRIRGGCYLYWGLGIALG